MQETLHEEQKKSRSMFFQCIILFLGICAGLWINIYFLVLVAAFTVSVSLFCKIENSYYHLLFCLPFSMIYKLSPTSSSLFAYVMIAVGVIWIFKIRRFGVVPLIFTALFAAYALFGIGSNFTMLVKMLMGFMLFYFFVKNVSPSDFKNQIFAFALGMLGSSCIGLLKESWSRISVYYSDMDSIYIDGERSLRFSGLYLDPNYYSISVVVAVALCLMLFFKKDGSKIISGILICALTIFGFISYSKTFLLSFVVLVLLFVLRALRSPSKIAMTSMVIVVGGFGLQKWMDSNGYMSVMLDRFSGGDISTGRFFLWETYMDYIGSSPLRLLFGDGLGVGYLSVGGPHNTYIEAVFFVGLIGSILFLGTLLSIFASNKYDNKRNIINYSVPILFCIMAASLGCFTINDLMFYCMLMWIGLNTDTSSAVSSESDSGRNVNENQKAS